MRISVCVPTVKRRSRKEIELEAEELLRKFAPDCLKSPQRTPMLRLFDRMLPQHFEFRPQVDILQKGLEGLTDWHDQTVTLAEHVYAGLEEEKGDSRFTTGHESGHVVLHAKELSMRGEDMASLDMTQHALARQAEVPEEENPEWQADVFSSALLMPGSMLAEVNRRYWSNLQFGPSEPIVTPPPLPFRKGRLRGTPLRRPRPDRQIRSGPNIGSSDTKERLGDIAEMFGVSHLPAEMRPPMPTIRSSDTKALIGDIVEDAGVDSKPYASRGNTHCLLVAASFCWADMPADSGSGNERHCRRRHRARRWILFVCPIYRCDLVDIGRAAVNLGEHGQVSAIIFTPAISSTRLLSRMLCTQPSHRGREELLVRQASPVAAWPEVLAVLGYGFPAPPQFAIPLRLLSAASLHCCRRTSLTPAMPSSY